MRGDPGRRRTERSLILVKIAVSDLQQTVERNIHHLFVQQFLAVVLRPNPEVAVSA